MRCCARVSMAASVSGWWLRARSEERRVGKECRCRWSRYQAEDGIRYLTVTGVQTCALPILARVRGRATRLALGAVSALVLITVFVPLPLRTQAEGVVWLPDDALLRARIDGGFREWLVAPGKIGRASCRERV